MKHTVLPGDMRGLLFLRVP